MEFIVKFGCSFVDCLEGFLMPRVKVSDYHKFSLHFNFAYTSNSSDPYEPYNRRDLEWLFINCCARNFKCFVRLNFSFKKWCLEYTSATFLFFGFVFENQNCCDRSHDLSWGALEVSQLDESVLTMGPVTLFQKYNSCIANLMKKMNYTGLSLVYALCCQTYWS